jgi:hypothetical protein
MASCRTLGGDFMRDWLSIAGRRDVAIRALKLAAVVGTILAAINHGDKILGLALDAADTIKIGVTYFVPYCVSTISSVAALRARERK